jgi:hypothetical protein
MYTVEGLNRIKVMISQLVYQWRRYYLSGEKCPRSVRATRNPQRFVCSSLGCDLLCKPDSCSPARPFLPEYSPCPQTPATFAGKFIGKMLGYKKYIYTSLCLFSKNKIFRKEASNFYQEQQKSMP